MIRYRTTVMTGWRVEFFYSFWSKSNFLTQVVTLIVVLNKKFRFSKFQSNLCFWYIYNWLHYEAKQCILWMVSGFRNKDASSFFCSFISFDRSDKILTWLSTCLWNPETYRQKIVPIQCSVWPRDMVIFIEMWSYIVIKLRNNGKRTNWIVYKLERCTW